MGFVYTKQDKRVVLTLLRVLTAFLVVCIFTKVWTSLATVRAAKAVAEAAIRASVTSQDTTQKDAGSGSDAVEQLRQSSLLVPGPPKQNPITEVTGVLGSEAFINGRWCKVGDMIGEARVLAVEATHVKVLWEGKTLVYSPVDARKPPAPDSLQAKTQYTSSAGQKPVQERSLQTYQVAAPYAEATGRSETRTFFSSAPQSQSRIGFSPGPEKPLWGPSPDMMERMRQMVEAERAQLQKAKPPVQVP